MLRRISGNAPTRHLLPEVLCRMFQLDTTDEAAKYSLTIYRIVDGQYKVLFINSESGICEELRASDAVLLSLVSAIPLYACNPVFTQQSTPYKPGGHDLSIPVNSLNDQMLASALKNAVAKEQYNLATHLRDEIRRRERERGQDKETR